MYMIAEVSQYVAVASFAEAWIEIDMLTQVFIGILVASFAEAWIEIYEEQITTAKSGRLLRGGVD